MSAANTKKRRLQVAHASTRRGGFTLLELMVAMTAGAIVISSMYFITGASTAYFREQQRISNVQSSLRYAMEQLRRDITRAGFCATPNYAFQPYRPPGNPPLAAAGIRAIDVVDLPGWDPVGGHVIDGRPLAGDQLTLTGNYATSSDYMVRGLSDNGGTVNLETYSQTFTRDFTGWTGGPPYATLTGAGNPFDTAFMPGRLVSLETPQGTYFSVIQAANAGAALPSVAIAPAMPPFAQAAGSQARVAPVSIIQYLPTPAPATLAHVSAAAAGDNIVLQRQEMQLGGGPLPNTFPTVVAERVVDFNIDYLANQNNQRNQPAAIAPVSGAGVTGLAAHTVFSALVTLAVRTALPDPRFAWLAQNPGEELTRFRYAANNAGATRVRIARAEIFLPNIANKWPVN